MINENMTIGEIVREYPNTVDVLYQFGMGCVGCPSAQAETIKEASMVHGLNLEMLIKALNEKA